jgi:hypothetical protein
MKLKHELWNDIGDDGPDYRFCLAGPHGDDARALLSPSAQFIWTVEAGSHFEVCQHTMSLWDGKSTQRITSGIGSLTLKGGPNAPRRRVEKAKQRRIEKRLERTRHEVTRSLVDAHLIPSA